MNRVTPAFILEIVITGVLVAVIVQPFAKSTANAIVGGR